MTLADFDPTTQLLDVDVTVEPSGELLDQQGLLRDDLTVTLHPGKGNPARLPKGTEAGTVTAQLVVEGDIDRWPFDHYAARNVTVEVGRGSLRGEHPEVVETKIVDAVAGWHVTVGPHPGVGDANASEDITITRAHSSLVFALLLCFLLVSLPCFGLAVAIPTLARRRPFHPPMVGWFAIMLFAVVPLRNLFPGAPPLGARVDRMVVIWVLLGVTLAMGLYLVAWWDERNK